MGSGLRTLIRGGPLTHRMGKAKKGSGSDQRNNDDEKEEQRDKISHCLPAAYSQQDKDDDNEAAAAAGRAGLPVSHLAEGLRRLRFAALAVVAAEQGINKLLGIKIPQIVGLLANADEAHRNFQLVADVGNYAAFSCAV